MAIDWLALEREFDARARKLGEVGHPAHAAFVQVVAAAGQDAALPRKTKELIALGIAVASCHEDCIAYHTRLCLRAGTNRDELVDMLGVTIEMGGGPALAYAAHVLECFDQMSAAEG